MFFILPLRVEQATVDRMPWVSIGIAASCALAFALTWVLPAHPEGASQEQIMEVVNYWQAHPRAAMPPRFAETFLRRNVLDKLDEQRQKLAAIELRAPSRTPGEDQRELDELVEAALASADQSTLRRFALVPARGALQPGWLTHQFLHSGWLHLLGNLLFFSLVGPLLEDLWGRRFFLAFYLLGGTVAALAHFALHPRSTTLMVGASGAIAACMGAFAYRCASRQVRLWYAVFLLLRFKTGTFQIPAWFWGLFWFASEVFTFWRGASGSVAVMAHIGGFAFGFATAVALAKSGFEARHLAPGIEAKVVFQQHEGHDRAQLALERGDPVGAAAAFREALAAWPGDVAAAVGLARAEPSPEAAAHLERLLVARLHKGDAAGAWSLVAELQRAFDPSMLSPRAAYLLAGAAGAAPEALRHFLPALDAQAGTAGGVVSAKACLQGARRSLDAGELAAARGLLEKARAVAGLPDEVRARVDELQARLEATEPTPPPLNEVNILRCRVTGLADGVLQLESAPGQKRTLDLRKVLAVGAGIVPATPGAGGPTAVILTDLVLGFGDARAAPAAIRLEGGQLGLEQLYPGVAMKEAYRSFVSYVLTHSGARPLPDRGTFEAGTYPRFVSDAEMNAALYGKRPEPV